MSIINNKFNELNSLIKTNTSKQVDNSSNPKFTDQVSNIEKELENIQNSISNSKSLFN